MTDKPRRIVRVAHPEVLHQAADSLKPVWTAIERKAGDLYAKVTGLDWKGRSYDGAVSRAEWEKTQMTRVADGVEQLADAFKSGANRMTPMVEALNTTATNLEGDRFSVEDDWTVRDLRDYQAEARVHEGDETALAQIARDRTERGNESKTETVRLQRLARELHDADVDTKRAIAQAEELIRALAPVTAGLSSRQAELDVRALREGTISPAGLARLNHATHFSPQQLESLRQGRPTEIPQGQYDYLRTFMTEVGSADMNELLRVHEQAPGVLGNALRVMSSPNVRTKAGSAGGLDQLPGTVVSLLRENQIKQEMVGSGGRLYSLTGVNRLDDFKTLNTILSDRTDRSLQLGTDVDRGMLKQASEIVGALPHDEDTPFGFYDENQTFDEVRQVASSMLSTASHDHQAVTDFLTGERMGVTVAEGHRYDADAHVLNVLTENWSEVDPKLCSPDDQRGPTDLFDWIGEAAAAPGYEGELGGKSADALARVLIENEKTLDALYVDKDHSGNTEYETLGERNPHLSQVLAANLAPYFGNFADAPSEVLTNHTAGPLADTVEFSKLIGVLSTDPGAGRIALTAAVQWENYLAHEFGSDPDNTELATAAGKIHSSMSGGLSNALETLADNDEWERLRKWNEDTFLIDSAGALVGAGGLWIPGLSEAAGLTVPLVKAEEISLPTADPQQDENTWRTEIRDMETRLDKMTTGTDRVVQVTSGVVEDRPDLWGNPWTNRVGSTFSFVLEDGTIDTDMVRENRDAFREFSRDIGAETIRHRYNDHFDESAEDPTIDETKDEVEVSDSAPR
ncbi:hypothetical protein [Gordonia terrae]|uniref:TPR repeat domain-containing protein n=2 Tax=Gordonia terrae TaxID=2055 RepID=A0AAD0K920_9ACTN|nr:hypothetical protein [Gordonia terrae]VTR11993.1 Uncharacterised protein [Clostridioides difficile]ANY24769.1 hypothetical protein BCM27_19930 [Gordonia terrae]AWO85514.1 hypothetical protein DLJ61_20135 [Gordonia terrae]VTS60162.1 Uncharacterised protein [Gordonia terrae]GAB45733.1 hypothetical protein GOTRE_129_00240 [Gordonia terrae NBRC 100016]